MPENHPQETGRPSTGAAPSLLVGTNLTKRYGSTTVLDAVNIEVKAGEVLAVVGENGAGKSTLMKILAGLIPDGEFDGEITLGSQPQRFTSVRDSANSGIVMVPQELHVIPHLSIAENMFAANLPGRRGFYDEAAAVEAARQALKIFDLRVDPRAAAETLTPSERRLVVLAGALYESAQVLILDEPTAALTDTEAHAFLERLQAARSAGVAIVYISHRLDELDRIVDRVMVLRNGQLVANYDGVPPRKDLVRAMLGAELESLEAAMASEHAVEHQGEPVLRVRDLSVFVPGRSRRARVVGASLDIYPGEIVGLYGLVGAGRTELGRALAGAWPGPVEGTCSIDGIDGLPKSTTAAIARGLSLLVEDRKSQGVFYGQSVSTNMTASVLDHVSKGGVFIDGGAERLRVGDLIGKLGVRPARPNIAIDALSGGNQQKVLLGRCLLDDLKVLVLDEPTLGVDVGARRDIYSLIRTIARDMHVGVLLISSDVTEVVTEADRVLVMYKSRITGEYPRGATAHELLAAATGA